MKRISREKDSEREENSPAERFSKIIFSEPALKAADEKSCRSPALRAFKWMIQSLFLEGVTVLSNWVVPRTAFVPFIWDEGFFICMGGIAMNSIYTDTKSASVILREAIMDKHVPEDFYSTTNNTTLILHGGNWVTVQNQRMDAIIVVNGDSASCKKLRDIKKGELLVCGETGIRVLDDRAAGEDEGFGFMNNCVSSERRNELIIGELADNIVQNRRKITFVLGPVVVHTGGDIYLRELISEGYVSSILAGNAVAVHDIEKSLYGTSLGICAKSGRAVQHGYRNHMRAINSINGCGGIKEAVEAGKLKSGIMYECVRNKVPFVLAGSLRDDGPLPDTIIDMIKAQEEYGRYLGSSEIVVILGSMLHGIASGNMLPAKVDMVCVDINPAVVTKLSDRGSSQAAGIVTDVGLFLNLLVKELKERQLEKAI